MPRRVSPTRDHPRSRGEYRIAFNAYADQWGSSRSRGEYNSWMRASGFALGSSPLSRGILPEPGAHLDQLGIIPALAGNTRLLSPARSGLRDHPRSRGEYACAMTPHSRQEGSSPLSRGIQGIVVGGVEGVRIIPALAGNTLPRHHRGGGERDHPRSRGEYLPRGARSGRPGGSSPLSRGIRGQSSCWPKSFRIIPALAGNTSSPRPPAHGGTDHPRSRGEYVTDKVNGRLHAGSSPLSRGIRPVPGRFAATPWIIPALAGNTRTCSESSATHSDHPRSRGEYSPRR